MKGPFAASVGDVDLVYEVRGSGPSLLVLGGTGWDLRKKPSVFDTVLAKRFTLLHFDQRGMGRSGKPDRPYSMVDYADDAAGVMEALGWARAHILGYSFGGMVAQEFAIRHPDRVDRLVLAATTAGGTCGGSYPLHELAELPPEERARRSCEIRDLRFTPAFQAARPTTARREIQQTLAAQSAFMEEPGARIGMRRQLEARAGHDTCDRLTLIGQPTLVCAGEFDGQAPFAHVQAMAERLPLATVNLYPGSHLFLWEYPNFFDDVAAFLGSGDQQQ